MMRKFFDAFYLNIYKEQIIVSYDDFQKFKEPIKTHNSFAYNNQILYLGIIKKNQQLFTSKPNKSQNQIDLVIYQICFTNKNQIQTQTQKALHIKYTLKTTNIPKYIIEALAIDKSDENQAQGSKNSRTSIMECKIFIRHQEYFRTLMQRYKCYYL
ncbi:hypothetical protein pb186bvf_005330, partial [Paramecium bursaria]